MALEARALRRAAALSNIHADALVTGVGPWPSGFSMRPLTEAVRGGGAIVALGFAGGLDPTLKVGDLVTATQIQEEAGPPIECDREMLATVETIASESGCRPLPAYTSRRPVCTPTEKRDLFDRTGASFVTMEDYYFAKEASRLGVPFISVRAVVDTADQFVPPQMAGIGNASVASQAASGLSYAVTHPWNLPALIALGIGASRAAQTLERFLHAYLPMTMQETTDRRIVALDGR
jgi:nucleoside phosphorylase